MRFVKRALIALVLLLIVLVAVAYVLPSHYKVVRSIDIDAPPAKVYPLVATVKTWQQWAVWNRRDPNMKIVYSGPEAGTGAKWVWDSKSEGKGEMTLTAAEPDKRVGYSLYFPDFNSTANGNIEFTPVGATGTHVTWSNDGDLGNNPMMRWMGLAMDKMVGADFDAGLANLKALAKQ